MYSVYTGCLTKLYMCEWYGVGVRASVSVGYERRTQINVTEKMKLL